MKKLFFLGACLVALASPPVKAQAGGADVIIVRVTDAVGSAKLVIARPGDKTEEVKLDSGADAGSMRMSALTLQRVIAGLCQEGYALKSTFGGANGFGATLVFVKEK